ncbi:hypothetical protein CXB51_027372 [Gossypium anomalum]|uniref:DUF4283 domain-containing protein n=1 Tax=Gossypium anomalum TaxID=47600 RepID=A0A8J5YBR8_9ROSI|nr:hypothetical protein CXB51_027372 [Gossypium anomalum]
MADVEGNFQGQSLKDAEEKEAVKLKAAVSSTRESLENCLVGTFLTSSVINFSSMRATLANVWHPIGRIMISDLFDGRFLYRLFYKVDVNCIKAGGPWNFNSHLLILQKLHDGDNPKTIPLNTVDFWVLVQDLPHGFSLKLVARQMGNFIGQFIDYDCKAINFGYTRVLRDDQKLSFGRDISLKALFRRAATHSSKWLREGGGAPAQDGPSNGLSDGDFDNVMGEDDPMFNGEGLKRPRLHLANSEGNNNGNGDEYQNKIPIDLAQRASRK